MQLARRADLEENDLNWRVSIPPRLCVTSFPSFLFLGRRVSFVWFVALPTGHNCPRRAGAPFTEALCGSDRSANICEIIL
jgi:hypothetical protein